MSVDTQIAAMKAQLCVVTDTALAAALRIDKANPVKWRRQGWVSQTALRRAELIAQHGQIAAGDSLEKIAADIAVLNDRLHAGRMHVAAVTRALDALSTRSRKLALKLERAA